MATYFGLYAKLFLMLFLVAADQTLIHAAFLQNNLINHDTFALLQQVKTQYVLQAL